MTELYVYFSRPNDTIEFQPPIDPVCFGPFEFVHLTYSEIRTDTRDPLAWLTRGDGVWRIRGDRSEEDLDYWYSDVVVTDQRLVD